MAILALAICAAASAVPHDAAVFTSTRHVTCIALADNGDVWVGTTGGILRYHDGAWTKFTRGDGLPGHEVRSLSCSAARVAAVFPDAAAEWDGRRWRTLSLPQSAASASLLTNLPGADQLGRATTAVEWQGNPCVATLHGLHIWKRSRWIHHPLPESAGSHISAMCDSGKMLLAAMFGDGIWRFDGSRWARFEPALPHQAREIAALAAREGELWVGTRREGVWTFANGRWTQHLQPDELVSHNIYALALFRDNLFASTMDDGLLARTSDRWQRLEAPTLSSNSPRQMAVFQDALYLRHSNGKVDRYDGTQWQLDVFADLPRRWVSSIAADERRIYAAVWGGWSEWDGARWTHHLDLPDLQGEPTTALLPEGERLWIATQRRGLAEFDLRTGQLAWHDERHGLPDDWVTALMHSHGRLFAGTFSGGLAVQAAQARWETVSDLRNYSITALCADSTGTLWAGTRNGPWRLQPGGSWQRINDVDQEVQALCADKRGLWVGCRTALYFLDHRAGAHLTHLPGCVMF